jgi:5-methylcytosine-specific restriction protein B
MFLDERVVEELYKVHAELRSNGRLIEEDQLYQWGERFRERFSPTKLSHLDGPELLYLMYGNPHSADPHSKRDDLMFWLNRKRDEEFPSDKFGTLSLGPAGVGLVFSKQRQSWMKRAVGPGIDEDTAINIARQERDELVLAAEYLENFPSYPRVEDYIELQKRLDTTARTVSNSSWGHKYLSLLFPDLLDFFHGPELQRFHLAKLLVPLPYKEGRMRYTVAAWFRLTLQVVGIARMQHLAEVLSERHGQGKSYYALDVRGEGVAPWPILLENSLIALDGRAVSYGGALVKLQGERVNISSWRNPHGNWLLGPHRVSKIPLHTGDVVLARDNEHILAVGLIDGHVQIMGNDEYTLRAHVTWRGNRSMKGWRLPHEHLVQSPPISLRSRTLAPYHENILEIERHLLYDEILSPPADNPWVDVTFPLPRTSETMEDNVRYEVPLEVGASSDFMHELPALTGILARAASALERKGQVIFFGPPGTGKSHWAERTSVELAARSWFDKEWGQLSIEEREEIVSIDGLGAVRTCCFHPAYGYEDFLEGYRPKVTTDEESGLRFEQRDGVFKRLCADAAAHPHQDYFLLIDEINRGDAPRIFGELLAVMEKGKRGKQVLLPLSGEPFAVPKNIYIIGTMNTADRSIALLDAALRRRFGFIELLPEPSVLASSSIRGLSLVDWLEALNKRITQKLGPDGRHLQVGHAYFLDAEGIPINDIPSLAQVLRDEIIPLLEEYCYEDLSLLSQLLGTDLIDADSRVRDELLTEGREGELLSALAKLSGNLTTVPVTADIDGDFDGAEETSV